MDFRQLIATAESVCDFSQDPEVVNIYLSSLANNEATSELYILLKEECNHSGLKVNIFKTGSAGYYDLEPTVLVEKPAGPAVLYCNVNRGKILAIVKDFLKGENPGLDLAFCSFGDKKNDNILRAGELSLFKRQDRIALRNCGCVDPLNVNHYILRSSGYRGLSRCLSMRPDEVIDALRKSGLRGRGGAGFNTAEKWQACREAGGSEKYVVCNAVDSDPQALTARLLLEGDPHSIIEGILIAAYAVGASHCLLVAAEEYREAVARLNTGLRQAREYNLLGTGILGTAFNTEIEQLFFQEPSVHKQTLALSFGFVFRRIFQEIQWRKSMLPFRNHETEDLLLMLLFLLYFYRERRSFMNHCLFFAQFLQMQLPCTGFFLATASPGHNCI